MSSEQTFAASCSLITFAELTEQLRLSPPTVRQLIKDGRLPAIRIGRRLLFTPLAVQEFIRAAETKSA